MSSRPPNPLAQRPLKRCSRLPAYGTLAQIWMGHNDSHTYRYDNTEVLSMHTLYSLMISLATFLYRKSGGRIGGKMRGGDVLLLTTTGRKTGKQRTVPLIYIMDGSAYVLTASIGGAPKHPGWFFNLRNNPQAVIQVK